MIVHSKQVLGIKQMHGQRDLVLTGKAQEGIKERMTWDGRKERKRNESRASPSTRGIKIIRESTWGGRGGTDRVESSHGSDYLSFLAKGTA